MYKKENGITLIILVITVMVLMVIAGVIIDSGLKSIKQAEQESLRTNMLLIQAAGKQYVENANFHIGTEEKSEEEKENIKNEDLKGTPTTDLPGGISLKEGEEAYSLSMDDMRDMGLSDEIVRTAEDYIIIYNIKNQSVDVIYKLGTIVNNEKVFSLSEMENK